MAKPIPEHELREIEAIVAKHPDGVNISSIEKALPESISRRTLQYRLKHLVDTDRLLVKGERRGTKYFPNSPIDEKDTTEILSLSAEGVEIQALVSKPLIARIAIGYNRAFLDNYRPNESAYFSDEDRVKLKEIGAVESGEQAAGTYARRILDRLLIDLSWNSSRLEGNTYSLLDTRQLIDFGKEAEGKERLEAQMILNHKDAIEFLVEYADDIGFNRYTILNLHGLLANNLLSNPQAAGRLRHIIVAIEKSTFRPLEVPQLIEECFDQILATAAAIKDPFEQSLFVMIHLPYLQPFDDVNKRVSRLAANIPLIKHNLVPLAFSDVPQDVYTQAMLGIYELNRTELLRDIYLWAYQRSADHYAAVRQSLGEPDPFRLQHRDSLRLVVREIVQTGLSRKQALQFLENWVKDNIPNSEQKQFIQVAETELLALHEGNFARYQIRPSEFEAWSKTWNPKK